MKPVSFFLAFLFCLSGCPAFAEVLQLGRQEIAYQVPEGYIEAGGAHYAPLMEYLRTQYPPEMTIGLVLVAKKADEKLRAGASDSVDDYIILTHERLAGDMDMVDFITLKEYLIDEFSRSTPEQLDEALGAVFETEQGDASFRVTDQARLVSETSNSFSHLFTGRLEQKGRQSDLLLLHTMEYCGGELLHIYQYCTDGTPPEAFLLRAGNMSEQLRLSPQREYAPQPDEAHSGISRGTRIFGAALVVGMFFLAVSFWRRKRSGSRPAS